MSSRRGSAVRFLTLLCAASLLWACSGDDGAAGPAGPTGGAGPVESAEKINVEISSVVVPAGGGAPTVELTLSNDLTHGLKGLPAANIRFLIAQLTPAIRRQ